jgi:hypothetical protein
LAIKVHEILRAERIEILHEQCTTTCLNCCQTTLVHKPGLLK